MRAASSVRDPCQLVTLAFLGQDVVEQRRAEAERGRQDRLRVLQRCEHTALVARCETRLATTPHERIVAANSGPENLRVEVPQRAALDGGALLGVQADGADLVGRERSEELERREELSVRRVRRRSALDVRADAGRDMGEGGRAAATGSGSA